jgi:hypothetical protein
MVVWLETYRTCWSEGINQFDKRIDCQITIHALENPVITDSASGNGEELIGAGKSQVFYTTNSGTEIHRLSSTRFYTQLFYIRAKVQCLDTSTAIDLQVYT